MTPDAGRTRIRLEEVLEDIRTLEQAVSDPLTLEPAIQNLEMTIEAYERLEIDSTEDDNSDR